jgi:hypothetical protein
MSGKLRGKIAPSLGAQSRYPSENLKGLTEVFNCGQKNNFDTQWSRNQIVGRPFRSLIVHSHRYIQVLLLMYIYRLLRNEEGDLWSKWDTTEPG